MQIFMVEKSTKYFRSICAILPKEIYLINMVIFAGSCAIEHDVHDRKCFLSCYNNRLMRLFFILFPNARLVIINIMNLTAYLPIICTGIRTLPTFRSCGSRTITPSSTSLHFISQRFLMHSLFMITLQRDSLCSYEICQDSASLQKMTFINFI